jgi:hypothetical protein
VSGLFDNLAQSIMCSQRIEWMKEVEASIIDVQTMIHTIMGNYTKGFGFIAGQGLKIGFEKGVLSFNGVKKYTSEEKKFFLDDSHNVRCVVCRKQKPLIMFQNSHLTDKALGGIHTIPTCSDCNQLQNRLSISRIIELAMIYQPDIIFMNDNDENVMYNRILGISVGSISVRAINPIDERKVSIANKKPTVDLASSVNGNSRSIKKDNFRPVSPVNQQDVIKWKQKQYIYHVDCSGVYHHTMKCAGSGSIERKQKTKTSISICSRCVSEAPERRSIKEE